MDALTVINELNAFANASNELSYETYRLFHCCLTFMNNITPIEKFYALSKIKPLLHKSLEPMSYGGNGSTAISTPSTEQLLDRVSPDDQKEILDKVDALTESAHQLSLSPVKEVKLAGMSIGRSFPLKT